MRAVKKGIKRNCALLLRRCAALFLHFVWSLGVCVSVSVCARDSLTYREHLLQHCLCRQIHIYILICSNNEQIKTKTMLWHHILRRLCFSFMLFHCSAFFHSALFPLTTNFFPPLTLTLIASKFNATALSKLKCLFTQMFKSQWILYSILLFCSLAQPTSMLCHM